MLDDIGGYASDVWKIFGLNQLDLDTNEYDLRAYLDWRLIQ